MTNNYVVTRRNGLGFGINVLRNRGTVPHPVWEPYPLYEDRRGNLWVAAIPGESFGLEFVVPDFGGRFLAIPSVEGRSIVSGMPSTGGHDEPGLLFAQPEEYGANVVPGWIAFGETFLPFVFRIEAPPYATHFDDEADHHGIVTCHYYTEYVSRHEQRRRNGGEVPSRFVPDTAMPPIQCVLKYSTEDALIRSGMRRVSDGLPRAHEASPSHAADDVPHPSAAGPVG